MKNKELLHDLVRIAIVHLTKEINAKNGKKKEKLDFPTVAQIAEFVYQRGYTLSNKNGRAVLEKRIQWCYNDKHVYWAKTYDVNIVPIRQGKQYKVIGYKHVPDGEDLDLVLANTRYKTLRSSREVQAELQEINIQMRLHSGFRELRRTKFPNKISNENQRSISA